MSMMTLKSSSLQELTIIFSFIHKIYLSAVYNSVIDFIVQMWFIRWVIMDEKCYKRFENLLYKGDLFSIQLSDFR